MRVDELEERLKNEFPNVYRCVLINGEWGIGKTYFFKNKFLKNKEFIYISLFGVNSIEAIKIEIYSKINKICNIIGKIKTVFQRADGNSIGLGPISLPITYWETDISSAISKNIKEKTLTIVIDDLERKSSKINIEDLIGTIEKITQIKNINVILIANEDKLENGDKNKFLNFKEKVIQKTYNVHRYSNDAPKNITKYLLKDIELKNNIDINTIINSILEVFESHSAQNLRTLEKGINFLKLVVQYINLKELDISEIKDVVIASLSIVIEKIEGTYTETEENLKDKTNEDLEDKLICCIIKNYFREQYFESKKDTLVRLLLYIYEDRDVQNDFEKLNKFYKDLHTIDECKEDKSLLYMSEEQIEEKVNDFHNNYIVKTDKSLDVNNWFKKLNEIYTYAKVIGKEDIFKDEEILKAMDSYLENLKLNEYLSYNLDRYMTSQIVEEKIVEYNMKLNKKIAEKYYSNSIQEIIQKMKKKEFDTESLDRLYTIYTEENIDFDKQKIINMMEKSKYFIPDLNFEISNETWKWAHNIWRKAKSYKNYRKDQGFEKCVNELLKHATKLGRYRIELLNKRYDININN